MKLVKLIGVIVFVLVTAFAFAWSVGDRILGQWSDGLWYPAKIAGVQGDKFAITFDDGDVGVLADGQIKRIDWRVGTKVQCNFRSAGTYYPGTITQMRGEVIHINYDDGDQEDATIGRCRAR
jgi:hypothetical protein